MRAQWTETSLESRSQNGCRPRKKKLGEHTQQHDDDDCLFSDCVLFITPKAKKKVKKEEGEPLTPSSFTRSTQKYPDGSKNHSIASSSSFLKRNKFKYDIGRETALR